MLQLLLLFFSIRNEFPKALQTCHWSDFGLFSEHAPILVLALSMPVAHVFINILIRKPTEADSRKAIVAIPQLHWL
ncbi:hypothetical protein V8C40DRAFT_254856 [Trichoderma camerunense]